jgi:hypothetical protein
LRCAPMARTVPSLGIETEYPDSSLAASPSIPFFPFCFQEEEERRKGGFRKRKGFCDHHHESAFFSTFDCSTHC